MNSMDQRALALAGLLQALRQVRRVAETGSTEGAPLATCIESLFRIDAEDAEAVYGGAASVRDGARLLVQVLEGQPPDPALPRLAFTVLQLERRFVGTPRAVQAVRAGLEDAGRQYQHWGAQHPAVLARLGELYAQTLSHLRPRVMVSGNPAYLGQPTVVAEIRALLLAALRSAVLWRQLGGSWWDLALRRRALAASARRIAAGGGE